MKHLKNLSRNAPAAAGEWEDAICAVALLVNAFLSFTGGNLPLTQYLEDKCAMPVPNDTGGE